MQSYLLFRMHQNLGHWLWKHLSTLQKQNFRNKARVCRCCGSGERTSAGRLWVFFLPGLQAPDHICWFSVIRCTDTSHFLWWMRQLHSRELYDRWRQHKCIFLEKFLVLRNVFYWWESCFNRCFNRERNEYHHCLCLTCVIWTGW